MARKPRLDMAGFHHVLNRGVEQRNVFVDGDDFRYFLDLICAGCLDHDVNVHSYCLMSNHYHLLLETKKDNLSKFMRSLNAKYASYFNRKYKRVGHLWQGRFKSWYVSDVGYLYTLIKYIELNPLKAKMVENLSAYEFSSYSSFVHKAEPIKCLEQSLMFEDFKSVEERIEFFKSDYDQNDLKMVAKASNSMVAPLTKKEPSFEELQQILNEFTTKSERNEKIKVAISQGYSQSQIAKVLGLSQPAITNILKR